VETHFLRPEDTGAKKTTLQLSIHIYITFLTITVIDIIPGKLFVDFTATTRLLYAPTQPQTIEVKKYINYLSGG